MGRVVGNMNDHGPVTRRDDPAPVVSEGYPGTVWAEVRGEDKVGAEVHVHDYSGRSGVNLEALLGKGAKLHAHGSPDSEPSIDLAIVSEGYNVGPTIRAWQEGGVDRVKMGERSPTVLRTFISLKGTRRVDIAVRDDRVMIFDGEIDEWVELPRRPATRVTEEPTR